MKNGHATDHDGITEMAVGDMAGETIEGACQKEASGVEGVATGERGAREAQDVGELGDGGGGEGHGEGEGCATPYRIGGGR